VKPNNAKKSDRKKWPDFENKPVVCIATGPSLTAQQIEYVRVAREENRCRVIAINEAGLREYLPLAAPWADVLYAADRTWWRHYQPQFDGYKISGELVKQETVMLNRKQVDLPAVNTTVLEVVPDDKPLQRHAIGYAVSGGHSGFQALQLAITCGASKTILIGYDCGTSYARNCHVDRPEQFKRQTNMDGWVVPYRRIRSEWPNDEVLNASIQSKIDAFPRAYLEDVL
jgi:hypothetical protein